MAASPGSERAPKRQRTSSHTVITLQCQVCHRSYERADHLNRHLDSHRNERLFRCDECPAAFNRRDLLLRHQTTHAKNAADGLVGPNRVAERATKACNSCVISKVKCDNNRPCKRCQRKSLTCSTRSPRSSSVPTSNPTESYPSAFTLPVVQDISQTTYDHDGSVNDVYSHEPSSDAQALLDLYNTTGYSQHTIPAFFDQIMVPEPEFIGLEYLQPPPDLTAWMPEVEWLGQVDIFGSDFTPAFDQIFESQTPSDPVVPYIEENEKTQRTQEASYERIDSNSAKKRHAVFKQSPWYWMPERNQHTFSEHDGINLDERSVDLASPPHQPYASNVVIPDHLSPTTRDRIFQLVSKTARSQITIPSFPSPDCIEKLIKVGIAKRTETDAWIHPYTFESESSRPEFLTALIAAGCICFGIPSVNRTGLALQEIVRVALNALVEGDNSAMRDLQYLQASMLWLDIGAFCGYRRKMEIAESNLQGLVTALRRAGRFDHIRYPSIVPKENDEQEELDKKWRTWVEFESYKRLVYHLFEHDMHMTMVKHRPPLITYAELTLPLPASRMLWLAPSAEIWKSRYLGSKMAGSIPSLRALLQGDRVLICLSLETDAALARSTFLHGIAAQIWEHTQQCVLLSEGNDASSQLWAQSRQQKLYQSLQQEDISCEDLAAVTQVYHQFLQMFLHVNLDDITLFAGRVGETAAHSAYIRLSPWSQTKEARLAICHAGQVVRAARSIPPYQIRGPDAYMAYHAIMVLWTYSMMGRDRAKKTGTTTPTRTVQLEGKIIFLDDPISENQTSVNAFVLTNSGSPHLRVTPKESRGSETSLVRPEICDLSYPSQVMKVGVRLLDSAHPAIDRAIGPPLIRALCGLMEELGGLK